MYGSSGKRCIKIGFVDTIIRPSFFDSFRESSSIWLSEKLWKTHLFQCLRKFQLQLDLELENVILSYGGNLYLEQPRDFIALLDKELRTYPHSFVQGYLSKWYRNSEFMEIFFYSIPLELLKNCLNIEETDDSFFSQSLLQIVPELKSWDNIYNKSILKNVLNVNPCYLNISSLRMLLKK